MGNGLMAGVDWPTVSLIIARAVYAVYLFAALAIAAPTITFPINSQVPPVARVSMPFMFTFSASTFSGSSSLDYTLSSAPTWLSLDGSTRTLLGVAPESAANTAPIIRIRDDEYNISGFGKPSTVSCHTSRRSIVSIGHIFPTILDSVLSFNSLQHHF
jgi:hypothetical protein